MGGNCAVDTHSLDGSRRKHLTPYLLPSDELRGEGRSLACPFRTMVMPPEPPTRHLAALCQQQSFLQIHRKSSNYAVFNMSAREGLGFNQNPIQLSMHSSAHTLTHLTNMQRAPTLFWTYGGRWGHTVEKFPLVPMTCWETAECWLPLALLSTSQPALAQCNKLTTFVQTFCVVLYGHHLSTHYRSLRNSVRGASPLSLNQTKTQLTWVRATFFIQTLNCHQVMLSQN